MKTNEINSNMINTRINLEEMSKLKEPKTNDKPIVKKDIVHITESKRESNILDKKLSPLELPLKVEKPFVSKEEFNVQEIDNILKKLNSSSGASNKGIRFEKDNYYNQLIIRVYNTDTGEQIKQIPPQDILDFAKKSEEITGILFDKKV
jgi:flagellar protein FlaG